MVDMFACLDQSRLRYLEDNQPQIQAAHFSGLEDAMADDGDAADLQELGHWLDNQWIVPYPPWPCTFLDCHINAKCAISIGSIKYPFKYVHKGPNCALLEYQRDEIRWWIDGWYISLPEAAWRILQFEMHDQIPPVVCLQVHLKGHHMVTFNPLDTIENIIE